MQYFVLYFISILCVSHPLNGVDRNDRKEFPPLSVPKPDPKKTARERVKSVSPTCSALMSVRDDHSSIPKHESERDFSEPVPASPRGEALDAATPRKALLPSAHESYAPSAADTAESEDDFEVIERDQFTFPSLTVENWWQRGPYSEIIVRIRSGKFNKEDSRHRIELLRALNGMVQKKNGRGLSQLVGLLCEHEITIDDSKTMYAVRGFLRAERKKEVIRSQESIYHFINRHNEKRTEQMQELNSKILGLLQKAADEIAKDERGLEEAITHFDVSFNFHLKDAINGTNSIYPSEFVGDSESDPETFTDKPIDRFMKKYGLNIPHKQAIEASQEMHKKIGILGKVATKHLTDSDA